MSESVRKAVADVTWWGEMSYDDNRPGVLDSALVLRDAYLAEHPADDGEPVTAEWLEQTGWRRRSTFGWDIWNPNSGDFVYVSLAAGFPEVSVGNHDGRSVSLYGFGRKATRECVRRLLRGLRIEVKR